MHGITDADVADAPPFERIARGFLQFIEGCDLGGYNVIAYDLPMLAAHLDRAGIDWQPDLSRILDAGILFRVMEPRDLAAAVNTYLGREHVGSHGALADTLATADVLEVQLQRYERFRDDPDLASAFTASRYDGPVPVDIDGKLTRDLEGDLTYCFGQHKGSKVRSELGYARWMLGKDFGSSTVKALLAEFERLGIDRYSRQSRA